MNIDAIKQMLYHQQLTPGMMAVVLLLAFILGVIHALGPGHGKSLMAAYLVGTRGRSRDALLLGLTITISHVFSVIVIGFVVLWIGNYFKSESFTIWLNLGSGIAVTGIGFWLLAGRWKNWRRDKASSRPLSAALNPPDQTAPATAISGEGSINFYEQEKIIPAGAGVTSSTEKENRQSSGSLEHKPPHHHPGGTHHHHHDNGSHHHHHHHYDPGLSVRSNIMLGISGGIVPCPKALVILLLAISLQRVVLGITIISVFSLGLAAVLVTIGIVMIKASHLLKNRMDSRYMQILPVLGAVIIVGLGILLVIRSSVLM
ncbi:MAG: sulfite exporter TauE/SafE family protein [Calditrichia bacterium]